MQLSPEDIAAAELCGVTFIQASPAQVQRLAMQRKVFYRRGEPVLATRGDGFYETVGTLQRLIEEGRTQQRDLAEWLQGGPAPGPEVSPDASLDAGPGGVAEEPGQAEEAPALPAPSVGSLGGEPEPDLFESVVVPPKRRARRQPAAAVTGGLGVVEEGPVAQRAQRETVLSGRVVPRPPGPAVAVADRAVGSGAESRGGRWLVAGAIRRGRGSKHWSTRQR